MHISKFMSTLVLYDHKNIDFIILSTNGIKLMMIYQSNLLPKIHLIMMNDFTCDFIQLFLQHTDSRHMVLFAITTYPRSTTLSVIHETTRYISYNHDKQDIQKFIYRSDYKMEKDNKSFWLSLSFSLYSMCARERIWRKSSKSNVFSLLVVFFSLNINIFYNGFRC